MLLGFTGRCEDAKAQAVQASWKTIMHIVIQGGEHHRGRRVVTARGSFPADGKPSWSEMPERDQHPTTVTSTARAAAANDANAS